MLRLNCTEKGQREFDGLEEEPAQKESPVRRWVAAVWGRGVGPGNLLYFPSGLKLIMFYPRMNVAAVTTITHARDEYNTDAGDDRHRSNRPRPVP